MGLLSIPPLAQAGIIGALGLFILGLVAGYVEDERYEARIEEAARIDHHAGEVERRIRELTESNRRAASIDGTIERLRDGVFLIAPGHSSASGYRALADDMESGGPVSAGGRADQSAEGHPVGRSRQGSDTQSHDRIRDIASEQQGRAAGNRDVTAVGAIKANALAFVAFAMLVALVIWRARGVVFGGRSRAKPTFALFANETVRSAIIAIAGGLATLALSNRVDIENLLLFRAHTETQIEDLERRVKRLAVSEGARMEAEQWIARMKQETRRDP